MCPILLETFWPYQVPASMSSGFFSSSKHTLSDTCSSLTVMSASKTVVLKEWLKKGFRADVNYLNLNDIRVVHSWPFSSIFHPFLTSFLSSFFIAFYSEMKLRIKKKWIWKYLFLTKWNPKWNPNLNFTKSELKNDHFSSFWHCAWQEKCIFPPFF